MGKGSSKFPLIEIIMNPNNTSSLPKPMVFNIDIDLNNCSCCEEKIFPFFMPMKF